MDSTVDSGRGRTRIAIACGVVAAVALGMTLVSRAGSRVNKVALESQPKGVTVVEARAAAYRPSRRYVGTIQPWVEARIGPQLVSAYVDTVLVRPGDVVRRGQVIATLDCRNASASSKAVSMQARAIQAEQEAIAHEAARVAELEKGGFASPNEIERRAAASASKQAELMETEAKLQRATLEVGDCVLRAPFAGEIAERDIDPGAFVRPGTAIAKLVDRSTVRVIVDVPETDFFAVAPGTEVRLRVIATGASLTAKIARRAPAADASTRTVRVEIDLPDADDSIPVGTSADVAVDVGKPVAATRVPLTSATIKGGKANLFVVDKGVARRHIAPVLGEQGSDLLVDPKEVPTGAQVVTEGRGALVDGDRVEAGKR